MCYVNVYKHNTSTMTENVDYVFDSTGNIEFTYTYLINQKQCRGAYGQLAQPAPQHCF